MAAFFKCKKKETASCGQDGKHKMNNSIRIIVKSTFYMALIGIIISCRYIKAEVARTESAALIIEPEVIPLGAFSMLTPVASGTKVMKNANAVIDYSNSNDGYIMVKYEEKVDKTLRAFIKGPRGESYTYIVNSNGEYEVFPLSEGNGSYQVGIYEHLSNTKYSALAAVTFQVTLTNEAAPFLYPNQYVNYNSRSAAVVKAEEIIGSSSDTIKNIAVVYNYVTENIMYDKELAASVSKGYLSDIDAVMKKGHGICIDYAAVMTAMLRSQRIPTKLVIGYTGKVYHAWVSVYSEDEGWIEKKVYFDGVSWKLMDPTFAASKKSADDKTYSAKFSY